MVSLHLMYLIVTLYLRKLHPDGELADLLEPGLGPEALDEEEGGLNVGQAHVHAELPQLPECVLLEERGQHVPRVVHLVVCPAEQIDRVRVGDGRDQQLLERGRCFMGDVQVQKRQNIE